MRTALAALAAALLLAFPVTAGAHALLEQTSPQRGAVVERQPAAVSLGFSEPVEGNFGAVRVYDAAGERADEGAAFHPGDDDSKIGVRLRPDLADGTYTATYRVVSADSHVISGGFVFSVGAAGPPPGATVAELIGESGAGPVADAAFGIARGLLYAAIALAVGGFAFLLLAWAPAFAGVGGAGPRWRAAGASFLARLRSALLLAAALGALGAVGGVVMQGAEAAGVPGTSALRWSIVSETLGTRFGTAWGLAVVAWLVFAALVVVLLRPAGQCPGRPGLALLAVPLAYLVLVPALGGHPSIQPPVALNFPANVLHVLAMAVWLGGLAALLFLVPAATRRLEGAERGRLLAAVLSRFSQVALVAVAVVLLTGLVQAYVYVREPADLLDTAYGRAVLIKFVLLLAVLALAAYNRRRSVPRMERIAAGGEAPGRAGVTLRRALRGELALLLVVVGVTAALAAYAPPISAQAGPYSGEATAGPAHVELTVDPARVGANQIHLYLFDAETGAQFTAAKEVSLSAALPDEEIGPLPLELRPSGPGHFVAPGAALGVAGEWTLLATVRVSAFDQYEADFDVPVE